MFSEKHYWQKLIDQRDSLFVQPYERPNPQRADLAKEKGNFYK